MGALIKKLDNVSEQLSTLANNTEIHQLISELLTSATGAEYASIWVYDGEYLVREREDGTKKISMKSKEGLLYQCFAMNETIVNNHLTSTKGYAVHIDNPDNIKIKSKMMIPINVRDTFIGIVTVYSSIATKKNFTKKDLDVFSALLPLVIDAIFKINFNNNKGLLVDRRQGDSAHSSFKRRKGDISNKLESIENRQPIDAQKILESTSNIVHDIRTPANGLLGFLEILSEKIEDSRLKEYITNARKSALLIETLTTSILDGISDKREPVMQENKEIEGSKRFFAEVAEVFSANMYKKSITYTIYIDPELPNNLPIDEMKLKRVILNLISNASKFTPEHASISFFVIYNKKKNKLRISVEDTGIGIAKERQKEIFEAFKQAEVDTKEKFGGTGLGLAISAAYVKEMGGKLLLKSELDKGSKFYFDIPVEINDEVAPSMVVKDSDTLVISVLCDKNNMAVVNTIFQYLIKFGIEKEQIKAITSLKNIPQNTSHIIVFENKIDAEVRSYLSDNDTKQLIVEENFLSLDAQDYLDAVLISQYSHYCDLLYTFVNEEKMPKVLIVEDDSISSMLLRTMLQDEYCSVDVASDGEEGKRKLLKALSSNVPYDVVYTDENMPLLSGSEMIRQYKAEEMKKNIKNRLKVVFVSGDTNDDRQEDVFDFLALKPYKKKEIISIFNEAIMK